MSGTDVFNINIGIIGHVDSGKTSLAKAISSVKSTACFDKNPQSQQRGITLDLGFSSIILDVPQVKRTQFNSSQVQLTLVDCPGHASLLKTVIGGAHIIDMAILVIDVNKGIQAQTSESVVIADIFKLSPNVIVLNKMDAIQKEDPKKFANRMKEKIRKALANTVFSTSPFVEMSLASSEKADHAECIDDLIKTLLSLLTFKERAVDSEFLMSVDHCFNITGQGSVMTGTVLFGSIKKGDNVEISELKVIKKVKSLQIFRKNVQTAKAGDRVALCLSQFDCKDIERSLISFPPGTLSFASAAIVTFNAVPYYKDSIISGKTKMHCICAHSSTLCTFTFFSSSHGMVENGVFDFQYEYSYVEDPFSKGDNDSVDVITISRPLFALIEFNKEILLCDSKFDYVTARLDVDISHFPKSCRLAGFGRVLRAISDKKYKENVCSNLKVYKLKCKIGFIERFQDSNTLIGQFSGKISKKSNKVLSFIGFQVKLSTGDLGKIDGTFGQSGKFKIYFSNAFSSDLNDQLSLMKKGFKESELNISSLNLNGTSMKFSSTITFSMYYKRYVFDRKRKITLSEIPFYHYTIYMV